VGGIWVWEVDWFGDGDGLGSEKGWEQTWIGKGDGFGREGFGSEMGWAVMGNCHFCN